MTPVNPSPPRRIGLLGCDGRMGKRVRALLASEFSARGKLAAALGRGSTTEDLLNALDDCDVVIDFSTPEAAANLASKISAVGKGPALVIASTGWSPESREVLEEAARHVPVLISANFSLGALAFLEILRLAAPLLDSLGYKPVLIETHHARKKDAPSGTALALQRTLPRADAEICSIRAGEVVGDHQITFYGPSALLRFEHSARDRDVFARGAIEAALWLADRSAKDPSWRGIVPVENFFSDLKRAKAPI